MYIVVNISYNEILLPIFQCSIFVQMSLTKSYGMRYGNSLSM